jgi:hypothetical protein
MIHKKRLAAVPYESTVYRRVLCRSRMVGDGGQTGGGRTKNYIARFHHARGSNLVFTADTARTKTSSHLLTESNEKRRR